MNKKKHSYLIDIQAFAVMWCFIACSAVAQSPEEESLEVVRNQIRILEEKLAEQNVERDRNHRALRQVEVEISSSSTKLRVIQEELRGQQEQAQALGLEIEAAEAQLIRERDALSNQVRMNYLSGRQEKLKLLLNQESPARLGRMMIYYDYLNRARRERVNIVITETANLAELESNSRDSLSRLMGLEDAQETELLELEGARQERQIAINRIETDILGAGGDIARLREEEERLRQVIEEVRALLSDFPIDLEVDFERTKGTLLWPVSGPLINNYGDSREEGQLTWSGVLISAPSGTPVRAICLLYTSPSPRD